MFYHDSTNQQRPSTERTVNELRINISSPSPTYQQQQNRVSLPADENLAQQRVTNKQLHSTLNQAPRKSQYEDHTWISDDQRKSLINSTPQAPSSSSSKTNSTDRRSASLTPRHNHIHYQRFITVIIRMIIDNIDIIILEQINIINQNIANHLFVRRLIVIIIEFYLLVVNYVVQDVMMN